MARVHHVTVSYPVSAGPWRLMFMAEEPERRELSGLSQLRRHLDRLHATADLAPDLLVQDLETVYEELRTSEEEVRVQQEQISRLLSDHATEHRQFQRMLASCRSPC